MLAWNQRPRNSRRDSARAPRRLRVRCSAYSSPPLRVHTPVLQRAGQACACAYCVCAWPGARVRPLSDLEPPRSSREPLPTSLLPSRPHAQYLPPLSPLPQLLSLSFSAALFPSPSLSLSFAPSATQSAMDSRRVRNWLTVNVEFLGYVGEKESLGMYVIGAEFLRREFREIFDRM